MKADPCSVADCAGTVYSRDWCQKHYNRWYRAQNAKADARTRNSKGQFVGADHDLPPLRPTDVVPDPNWQLFAACRGKDFTQGRVEGFNAGRHTITVLGRERKAVCDECPVLEDCYAWMMQETRNRLIPGVLAGTFPSQRYGNGKDLDRELRLLRDYDWVNKVTEGVSSDVVQLPQLPTSVDRPQ